MSKTGDNDMRDDSSPSSLGWDYSIELECLQGPQGKNSLVRNSAYYNSITQFEIFSHKPKHNFIICTHFNYILLYVFLSHNCQKDVSTIL